MSAYNATVLGLTPKLYWRFGEYSGTTATDASGNSNTGTYGAGVSLKASGPVAADYAAAFSNASTSIVTSSYSPLVVGSSRTFMGWANRSSTADQDTLFGSSSAFPGVCVLRLSAGGQNLAFYAGGSSFVGWVNPWPALNEWVHWAITYNDATLTAELFINGASQGTNTFTSGNGFSGTGGTFQAGAWQASNDPFNGSMDEIAVFESILTSANILACYNAAQSAEIMLSATTATTVATADELLGVATASTSHTNKTGKSTAWGVLQSQGNTSAWAAGASEPAFGDVHGWLLDDTTLEGKTIKAGTWSVSCRISTTSGTVTAVPHMRIGKRSSAGVYTEIVNIALASHGFTSTSFTSTGTGSQGSDVAFVTGDKLYVQIDFDITANSSSSTTATTSIFQNTTADSITTPTIVTSPVANTLTASPGSMAITGSAATLTVSRKLSVSPGSVAITGSAAKLSRGYSFTASATSFAISGDPTTLVYTPGTPSGIAYTLSVSPGSLAVTGGSITSPVARKVSVSPASMSITGFSSTLPVARKLTVSPRAIVITGSSATLPVARKMTVSPGSYAITGSSTTSRAGRGLAASPGAYTISGADATLVGPGPPPQTGDPNVQSIPLALITHSI